MMLREKTQRGSPWGLQRHIPLPTSPRVEIKGSGTAVTVVSKTPEKTGGAAEIRPRKPQHERSLPLSAALDRAAVWHPLAKPSTPTPMDVEASIRPPKALTCPLKRGYSSG